MKNAPVIDDEDKEEEVWTTLKKLYDLCKSGWGKGNLRYGIPINQHLRSGRI